MRQARALGVGAALTIALLVGMRLLHPSLGADHNDPNSINSIFSDIDVSAADLYDLFGFPSDDTRAGENVVVALTFASVPRAGVLDPDMLYRIRIYPGPRVARPLADDQRLEALLDYFEAVKQKYLHAKPAEVRVTVDRDNRAHVEFIDFAGGNVSKVIDTNKTAMIETPGGHVVKTFVGGRDDAFFNDLPGFFRSINYAPQFYRVPLADGADRELKIPKTLLELEGNTLFNYDPAASEWGRPGGFKKNLPPGPHTWAGNRFAKDKDGNYRFVYSGKDAQAGRNVNAVILEIPIRFITRTPDRDRIVDAWGES